MRKKDAFLGIDLGSTGVRALMVGERGDVLASQTAPIQESVVPQQDVYRSEQDPLVWERALKQVLHLLFHSVEGVNLRAVSVDSTSGIILPVSSGGRPLYHALLYNDIRAQEEALAVAGATGMRMGPSFALPKILWFKRHRPRLFERIRCFLPAAGQPRCRWCVVTPVYAC
jgi:xylulokinase